MVNNKFNKGTVLLEVSIISPEKFLNLLWSNNINVSKVKKIDLTTILFEVDYGYYDNIIEIVNKCKGKCKIVSRKGLVFFLERVKRQLSLVIGILIFIIGMYILSTHIWSIEINTKKNISPFQVRKILTELGVRPGIKKSDLDVYALEKKVESLNKDILWIRVRIEGSTLKVVLEEKVTPPDAKESELGDCIAKFDGEIKRIFVSSGTAQVKSGDIVKSGDVLISAIQGKEGGEYPVPAKGTVIANTFYEKEMEILIRGKRIESTGRKDKDIYLNLLGNKIYLKKAINGFKYYDKIKEENNFINTVIYFERDEKNVDLEKEVEVEKGIKKLENSLVKDLSNDAKIIDKKFELQEVEEGKIRLKVMFVVEQNIV